jgi:glutamyl-tRNA synthetase
MTVEALREYIISQGASQSQMTLEWDGIWTINKRIIDPVVPRHWALVEKDLVKVELSGGPAAEESKALPRHKKNAELGNKTTFFSSSILIEQADAKSFDDNEEVTLMDWGNAFVRSRTVSPEGVITAMTLELHVAGDFKKTKKKVTWLSAASASNELAPVTLIDYDYLITKKKLEEDDKVENLVTPVTEFKEAALADTNVLRDIKPGDTLQFERKGFYICDQEKEADGRLRFILIPDGRAAGVESKAVAALQAAEKAAKVAGGEAVKQGKKAVKQAKTAVAGAVDVAQKAVAGTPAAGADASIKIHKSDITSGFDIPVSTTVSRGPSSAIRLGPTADPFPRLLSDVREQAHLRRGGPQNRDSLSHAFGHALHPALSARRSEMT